MHLQRLARWLRAGGEDVATAPAGAEDRTIIALARAEERAILTCDRRLAEEAGPGRALRIRASRLAAQLAEFYRAFPADPLARAFTRCMLCNEPLVAARREDAAARVPPGVLARHETFFFCPRCAKIYWAGGHYRRIRATLERLRDGGDP